ncbi:MAG: LysR family transcriptional regulator [Betaproteobacteria bacterium]|nr:LysR family transcriptional regulator [Betaproteobacteria bacterium]
MDLNLRHVRAFLAVADLASFTRAAEKLHLSQPALTVQIRKLEQALDTRLLDRSTREVALTHAGRDLLPALQRALEDVDAIRANARQLNAGKRGVVRIAALPSLAAGLLPNAILDCRRDNPELRFVVKDAIATQVSELVLREEVDLGLTGGEGLDAHLECLHESHDELCLVFPRGHPIGERRRIGVAELAELPLVLTAPGTSVRALVDAAFRDAGQPLRVACETTYMMTAVAMVRAGLGLSILPASAREIHAEPGLRARPISGEAFRRRISVVKLRGRTLLPGSEAFLRACVAAMRGPAPRRGTRVRMPD